MAERPVRALRFQGFGLGLWSWPLLSLVLERFGTTTGVRRGAGPLTPTMANVEKWQWTDYQGRRRELVIHREVKE